tara:strand:- start:5727 stop:5891 length:165 start_codon:yes stop_codon:yes gene_type:complete
MWIRIIDKKQYGYETYYDSCNNINKYEIYFDGLFYQYKNNNNNNGTYNLGIFRS